MHFSTLFTLFLAAVAPVSVFAAPAGEPQGPPPTGVSFDGPHGTGFPDGPHGTGFPGDGPHGPRPTGTFSHDGHHGHRPTGTFSGPPPTGTPPVPMS